MTEERKASKPHPAIMPVLICGGSLSLFTAAGMFVEATLKSMGPALHSFACNVSDSAYEPRCTNVTSNASNGFGIALVFGVAGIAMLILALALKPKKEPTAIATMPPPPPPTLPVVSTCPSCEKQIDLGTAYCTHCGSTVMAPEVPGEGTASADH